MVINHGIYPKSYPVAMAELRSTRDLDRLWGSCALRRPFGGVLGDLYVKQFSIKSVLFIYTGPADKQTRI